MTGPGTKAYASNSTEAGGTVASQNKMSVAFRTAVSRRDPATCSRAAALVLAWSACLWPLAAQGQTYRERIGQTKPAPAERLPPRVATRPAAADAKLEQGRGGDSVQDRGNRSDDVTSGQDLVAEAARNVFEIPSLHARLRMRFSSQGSQVVAVGDYVQLGAGAQKLLRLDLKIPIGSKIGTMQEIRGRDYLWIIRDLPPDPPQLERVGLRKARIEIAKAEESDRMAPLDGWILLGGLSRLLVSLDKNFEFEKPRRATLSGVPVLLVRGRWKPASLARLAGGKERTEVPAQLPQEVELALAEPGADPPLFPYRIEFLRHSDEGHEQRGGRGTPLTVIEFFEVRRPKNLEPQQFEFDPEERESDDVTISYLRKLGIIPAKSP